MAASTARLVSTATRTARGNPCVAAAAASDRRGQKWRIRDKRREQAGARQHVTVGDRVMEMARNHPRRGENAVMAKDLGLSCDVRHQGSTQGEGPGALPPWDLKNTIFSGFLPLNYVIYIFESLFCYAFCYVGGLRKPAAW